KRSTAPVWLLYVNPMEDKAIPTDHFERIEGQTGLPISGQIGWQIYQGKGV
ncbi:MAG: hypothetical protein HQL93_11925, partial [Magnetococcales bacterium]|nr:hypothetical protein [Magnetococcales bacterium]